MSKMIFYSGQIYLPDREAKLLEIFDPSKIFILRRASESFFINFLHPHNGRPLRQNNTIFIEKQLMK